MKKICVITTSRSDYGLLKNVMGCIERDNELSLFLIVAGAHLSINSGMTIKEIENDGFKISSQIDYLLSSDSELSIIKGMALAMISFSELFKKEMPDMLIILGDRYEMLPICYCALNFHIPIAHISGGETTEGAIDEYIRHCLTKMSYLHFPGCEAYRKRIIQLGENPNRVFNFGDVGVENIQSIEFISKSELEKDLEFSLEGIYFCVTYHPVTLEKDSAESQIEQLLLAISEFPDIKFIFTYANADSYGTLINKKIEGYVKKSHNCLVCKSLGIRRYLSVLKYSSGVIGNSSSGIVEAPSLGIPTINIGNRQRGRLQASSIINCSSNTKEIKDAIIKIQTNEFKEVVKKSKSPYESNNTSQHIVSTIKEFFEEGKINIEKKFYDIDFEVIE